MATEKPSAAKGHPLGPFPPLRESDDVTPVKAVPIDDRPAAARQESRPRLLDLFCGGGGASMGYWLAGFEVVGVDSEKQPRYPFTFFQADALEFAALYGHRLFTITDGDPRPAISVAGHAGRAGRNMSGTTTERRKAMRIPWLPSDALSEAIPPDYTEWIGGYLLDYLGKSKEVAA